MTVWKYHTYHSLSGWVDKLHLWVVNSNIFHLLYSEWSVNNNIYSWDLTEMAITYFTTEKKLHLHNSDKDKHPNFLVTNEPSPCTLYKHIVHRNGH